MNFGVILIIIGVCVVIGWYVYSTYLSTYLSGEDIGQKKEIIEKVLPTVPTPTVPAVPTAAPTAPTAVPTAPTAAPTAPTAAPEAAVLENGSVVRLLGAKGVPLLVCTENCQSGVNQLYESSSKFTKFRAVLMGTKVAFQLRTETDSDIPQALDQYYIGCNLICTSTRCPWTLDFKNAPNNTCKIGDPDGGVFWASNPPGPVQLGNVGSYYSVQVSTGSSWASISKPPTVQNASLAGYYVNMSSGDVKRITLLNSSPQVTTFRVHHLAQNVSATAVSSDPPAAADVIEQFVSGSTVLGKAHAVARDPSTGDLTINNIIWKYMGVRPIAKETGNNGTVSCDIFCERDWSTLLNKTHGFTTASCALAIGGAGSTGGERACNANLDQGHQMLCYCSGAPKPGFAENLPQNLIAAVVVADPVPSSQLSLSSSSKWIWNTNIPTVGDPVDFYQVYMNEGFSQVCQLRIVSATSVDAYINGTKLNSTTKNLTVNDVALIEHVVNDVLIVPQRNVVRLVGTQRTGIGGGMLVAEMKVTQRNAGKMLISTDSSWKCTKP